MSNFTSVPDVAVGDSFPPSLWESAVMNNLNLGVCRQLADLTLTGTAASIDFGSLPATFAHLAIYILARGDTAALETNMTVRFNNDSGNNYDYSSVTGGLTQSNQTSGLAGIISAASALANTFGAYKLVIPHYAQATSFKDCIALGHYQTTSGGANVTPVMQAIVWKLAPVAINEIAFFPAAGNFAAGSRMTIYGLPA